MTDILRELLEIRDRLQKLEEHLAEYGYSSEFAPEIGEMQELERKLFLKVNEWDKP